MNFSVRGLVVLCTGLTVVVVAATVIGISAFYGLSAVHAAALQHIEAEQRLVRAGLQAFLQPAFGTVEALRNTTQYPSSSSGVLWEWPTSNNTSSGMASFAALSSVASTQFLSGASVSLAALDVLLADGTELRYRAQEEEVDGTDAQTARTTLLEQIRRGPTVASADELPNPNSSLGTIILERVRLASGQPLVLGSSSSSPTLLLAALRREAPFCTSSWWNETLGIVAGQKSVAVVGAPYELLLPSGESRPVLTVVGALAAEVSPTMPSSSLGVERCPSVRGVGETTVVVGLAFSSVDLLRLSSLLHNLRGGAPWAGIVYDADAWVLASTGIAGEGAPSSSQQRCSQPPSGVPYNATDAWCRGSASTSSHPAVAAMSRGAQLWPSTRRSLRYKAGGQWFFVSTAPIDLAGSSPLQLFVTLVVLEEGATSRVVEGRNISMGVAVALVVLLAGAAAVAVMHALAPLKRVAERMPTAAKLEDDAAREDGSAFAEVRHLQQSYHDMNDALNRIRCYVPQAVLVAPHAEDDLEDAASLSVIVSKSRRGRTAADAAVPASSFADVLDCDPEAAPTGTSASGDCSVPVSLPDAELALRAVTVVAMNVLRFHALLQVRGRATAVSRLEALVAVAEAEVSSRRGVLTFHGDRLTATFNAARGCTWHGRAGVQVATAVADAQPGGLRVRCGVATGSCVVGSVGGSGVKTLSTMGPAYTQATVLERLTGQYGEGCWVLLSQRTAAALQGQGGLTYVDLVQQRGADGSEGVSLVAAVTSSQLPVSPPFVANPKDEVEADPDDVLMALLTGVVPPSVVDLPTTMPCLTPTPSGFHRLPIVRRVDEVCARARNEVLAGKATRCGGPTSPHILHSPWTIASPIHLAVW